MQNSVSMANCLENIAELNWRLNPGNLKTVQWLAAAHYWRKEANNPHAFSTHAGLNRLLTEIQTFIPKEEFDAAWQQGASQPIPDALATAVTSLPT